MTTDATTDTSGAAVHFNPAVSNLEDNVIPEELLEVRVFRRLAKFYQFRENTVDTVLSTLPRTTVFTEFAVYCMGLDHGEYVEALASVDKQDHRAFRYLNNLYQEAASRFSDIEECQLWLLQVSDATLRKDSVLVQAGFRKAFINGDARPSGPSKPPASKPLKDVPSTISVNNSAEGEPTPNTNNNTASEFINIQHGGINYNFKPSHVSVHHLDKVVYLLLQK